MPPLPDAQQRSPAMRLLDLFCGAGGASMGYHWAGFEIIGVDHKPQPNYPFRFIRADVFEYLDAEQCLGAFDAIHASPPCQAFTDLKDMYNARLHADLLTPTRAILPSLGLPYVIENVEGSPMDATIVLCGSSFGLGAEGARLQRHRLFETNWPLLAPPCVHGVAERVIGVYGGHGRDRRRTANTQDFSTAARRAAMGIDWMTGAELSQAVPPAYTEFIGHQLLEQMAVSAQMRSWASNVESPTEKE
jgi:DNA (cytosine-5)-methyltransferase 1